MIVNPEKILKCCDDVKNLVGVLEKIYGTVIITSGYRTAEENAAAGGKQNSAHMKGQAVDLMVQNVSCIKIAAKALENSRGIRGVGLDVFQNYCHIDYMDRGVQNAVYWVYNRSGQAI